MNKFIYLLITSFSFVNLTLTQYQNVMISNVFQPSEVCISFNPVIPNQLVAGSNIMIQGVCRTGYYYSTNAGLNWAIGQLYSTQGQASGDPIITCDMNGHFYFTTVVNWCIQVPTLDKILCFKSTNGGINWSDGTTLAQYSPQMDDMPFVYADISNSVYRNNIYVVWSLYDRYPSSNPLDSSYISFLRSTDHGLSFSSYRRLSKRAGDAQASSNSNEGVVLCTGTNGEIYTSWAGSVGVAFNRSLDGGNTWLVNEISVDTIAGGWAGFGNNTCSFSGTPSVDCDRSGGPYTGTVYVSWADKRLIYQDVWLRKSTNQGLNWSPAVRVNNDPTNNKNQFFTHITVDQVTGFLYAVFYDNRNTTGTFVDVYLARSTNGGESFENVKINSSPISLCGGFGGDYIWVIANNNRVRPIWMNLYPSYAIRTAIIDTFVIGIQPISTEIPKEFNIYQNFPNPFNPTTKIRFQIPLLRGVDAEEGRGMLVKVIIYDILGREIVTIVNEQLQPGTYEVVWDAMNYPSGIYYYRLITENFTETKKMILIK